MKFGFSLKFMIFSLLLAAVSCRKADRDFDNSLRATKDQIIADQLTFDMFMIIDEACKKSWNVIPSYTTGRLDCAVVNYNLTTTPRTVNISFGAAGCFSTDGRYRKGNIVLQIQGEYGQTGTVVQVTTSSYKVDHYQISANHSFVFNGLDSDGNSKITFTYPEMILTDSLNRQLKWNGSRVRTLIGGAATLNVSDDIYKANGNTQGTSRWGNTFSASVTDYIQMEGNCRYIVRGKMNVLPNNLSLRAVDFGEQCDSNVTVTINKTLYYVAQD